MHSSRWLGILIGKTMVSLNLQVITLFLLILENLADLHENACVGIVFLIEVRNDVAIAVFFYLLVF